MWVKHRFCAYEREVFKKKREKEEKGREEFEWRKGGRREMQASLMEVFLLHKF